MNYSHKKYMNQIINIIIQLCTLVGAIFWIVFILLISIITYTMKNITKINIVNIQTNKKNNVNDCINIDNKININNTQNNKNNNINDYNNINNKIKNKITNENNKCLFYYDITKINIITHNNKTNKILTKSKKIITTINEVLLIYDNVHKLLFGNINILGYEQNEIKLKITIKKKINNTLGECIFKKCQCLHKQSIIDCNGPDIIVIYLDEESTGIRVAMTIAHEIMHIYIHYKKHYNKNIVNINGEEGLCELISYYVGLFIKSDINNLIPYYSYETNVMFDEISDNNLLLMSNNNYHLYKKYNMYFKKAYEEYNNYKNTLINYIDNAISLKGIIVI